MAGRALHASFLGLVTWLLVGLQLAQTTPRASDTEIAGEFEAAQRAFHAGQPDRAIAGYKEVLKFRPNLLEARMNLGLVYFSTGDYARASSEMTRVVEADPSLAAASAVLGLSYMKLGSPQRATAPLRRAVRLTPQDRDARAALAACAAELYNYREAAEQFRALFALEADQELALFQLGRNYLALSKDITERIARLSRAQPWMNRLKGDLLVKQSLWKEAEREYRKALLLDPEQPGLQVSLAYVLRNEERAPASVTVVPREAIGRGCLSRSDEDCEVYLRSKRALSSAEHLALGKALLRMGKDEPASDQFATVLSVQADNAEAAYWLIRTYAHLSEVLFEKLVAAFPDSGRTHQLRAETLQVREAYPDAIKEYRAAIGLQPRDTELYEELGGLYILTRSFDDARDLLDAAGRLHPSARIAHLLGQAYLGLDKPDQASVYLEKAVRSDPGLLEAHADLGRAYLKTGKAALAARELQQAARLDRSGDLHYLLYQCYSALGETHLASEALAQSRILRKAAFANDRAKLGGATDRGPSPGK